MAEVFLSRWSRLKRGETGEMAPASDLAAQKDVCCDATDWTERDSRGNDAPDVAARDCDDAVAYAAYAARGNGDDTAEVAQTVLCDEDMPPLDTLTDRSSVSMFFSQGVSEAVRRQALRRVFSGAAFNVRCELDEYAEDYSQAEPLAEAVAARLRTWVRTRQDAAFEEARDALTGAPEPRERPAGAVADDASPAAQPPTAELVQVPVSPAADGIASAAIATAPTTRDSH